MHLHSVAKIRNFCLGMFSSPGLAHSCLQPLQRQRRCQDPFRTHNVPVLAAQLLLSSSADPRKCRLTPQPVTAHSASNLLCCQSRPTAPPQPLGGVTPPCPLCHVRPGAATSPVLCKCPPTPGLQVGTAPSLQHPASAPGMSAAPAFVQSRVHYIKSQLTSPWLPALQR